MRTRMRLAALGLFLAPLLPMAAEAQATPENTVITNTATATWTDANGNTYTPATASVSVTVGFQVGIDATSPASVTPASPSTGNSIQFTVNNTGNGTDRVSVSTTAAAGITVTGYVLDGVTYATLAELNTALSTRPITAGASAIVEVIYTVAPGQGGNTLPVSLTATSIRDGGAAAGSDAATTNVIPTIARGVSVTPDGVTRDRLPSNGTTYTETFTVTNNGNASDLFNLGVVTSGTNVTIVSVNGTAGSSASQTIAAGGTASIVVVYTVASAAAAGTTENVTLTATSTNDGTVTDPGFFTVRVVRAQITMTKVAYRDNGTDVIGASDRVLPGEYVRYRITVTNAGLAAASTVSITDNLVATLQYDSVVADLAGWTFTPTATGVTAALTGTLAPSASRYITIRARVR